MSIYEDDKVGKNTEETHLNENMNTHEDDYDYLDSLMQDVMGTGEPEPADESKDDNSHINIYEQGDNSKENYNDVADLNVNQGIQKPAEEDLEIEKPRKRRVSLFQQMGIEQSGESKDNIDKKASLIKTENVDIKLSSNEKEIYADDKVNYEIEVNQGSNSEEHLNLSDSYRDFEDNKVIQEDHSTPNNSKHKELEIAIDNTDSLFDGMLDDLTTMIDDNPLNKDNSENKGSHDIKTLDNEVEVPLEKPGMNEIKVTADGRTLADMIPSLRGGARSTSEVVKNIKEQTEVVEVQGKKFSDNRYTKHVVSVEEKREVQDERRALSNKFLQRNAKFTEQEKIIMDNLGVSNEQFASLMGSKELTQKEKEEIIGLGKYGAEKYFKGRRYRTTVGDSAILEFLTKFKFANTRILRWISNEPQGRTWRKLSRLRDNGLVESKSLIGIPDLWAATPAGVAMTGYDFTPGLRPMPKMITISSSMGVNYVAACLWFNTVNVLNLENFPANNRIIATQEDGRNRARGEMLVSELEIRSSLGKEITPSSTTMQTLGDERLYDVISANVRAEFAKWEESGRFGESPEFSIGNEFMWILYPTSQLTLSYHVPDLVVKRERGPNGEPKSIAVEMERYEKDLSRYDKTMLAYKLDEYLYEQVVWITPNTRVARALERSAKNVGFTRYTIVPIITETGVYNKQDIWMI